MERLTRVAALGTEGDEMKTCSHAYRCIHPCDDDECFLETLEEPDGPKTYMTKEQCDAFEEMITKEYREHP